RDRSHDRPHDSVPFPPRREVSSLLPAPGVGVASASPPQMHPMPRLINKNLNGGEGRRKAWPPIGGALSPKVPPRPRARPGCETCLATLDQGGRAWAIVPPPGESLGPSERPQALGSQRRAPFFRRGGEKPTGWGILCAWHAGGADLHRGARHRDG